MSFVDGYTPLSRTECPLCTVKLRLCTGYQLTIHRLDNFYRQ